MMSDILKEAIQMAETTIAHHDEETRALKAEIERLRASNTRLHINGTKDGLEIERLTAVKDAAEMLWVVLANVSGGFWEKQTEEWQVAAARWRDNYMAAVGKGTSEGDERTLKDTAVDKSRKKLMEAYKEMGNE